MSALEIPDSTGFRCGVQHERERIIRLLEQRREDLCLVDTHPYGRSFESRQAARSEIHRAITAIREAG